MKRIIEKLRYDGATAEQVHQMLADPVFREKVCDEQRVLRHSVRIDRTGSTMEVEIDQVQAAHGIPGFAKKFVGDEIHIVQSEQWSAPDHGDVHVSIPGKPGEMKGTAKLAEDAEGTTETVDLAVTVGIPLVGGKIEGLIADMLSKALRAEHRVGVGWLAERR
jgi:hypothetical protein